MHFGISLLVHILVMVLDEWHGTCSREHVVRE